MARERPAADLDRDLADLPPDLRWRQWLRRIEAVLFASATPVARENLARVVGQGVSVDLLIADLAADLAERPYEVAPVASGWMLRTKPAYAAAIRVAADVVEHGLDLGEFDLAVLAAVAYHQPITRDGLKDIFGRDISGDQIAFGQAADQVAARPILLSPPKSSWSLSGSNPCATSPTPSNWQTLGWQRSEAAQLQGCLTVFCEGHPSSMCPHRPPTGRGTQSRTARRTRPRSRWERNCGESAP
jgi:segregation and condensation protein B